MQINTNVSSMVTQNYLRQSNEALGSAMERLSSGKRINSAADDAAGLAIATRMDSKIRGMEVGIRNSNDGMSLIQTAESALGSVGNILQRMRDLAVQSANGTNSADDRDALHKEFTELVAEVDHIATKTTFNGIDLLNNTAAVSLQLSDVSGDTLAVNMVDSQAATLGVSTLNIGNVAGGGDATAAITAIDTALNTIGTQRATFGATLNRLSFNVDNITSSKNNLAQAMSRIQDADMAAEVSEMTRAKILTQSGMSMLSQANQNPQNILNLLG